MGSSKRTSSAKIINHFIAGGNITIFEDLPNYSFIGDSLNVNAARSKA